MKNNKLPAFATLFIALLGFTTGNYAQTTTSKHISHAKKEIASINLIYFDLYAKNDGSILQLYTADACLMPPDAPAICGLAALAKDFKDTYAAGTVTGGKFTTTEVYGNGNNFITEEGLFQIYGKTGETIDDGKFLKLWKKTKEGWKILRDSFNSNRKKIN